MFSAVILAQMFITLAFIVARIIHLFRRVGKANSDSFQQTRYPIPIPLDGLLEAAGRIQETAAGAAA